MTEQKFKEKPSSSLTLPFFSERMNPWMSSYPSCSKLTRNTYCFARNALGRRRRRQSRFRQIQRTFNRSLGRLKNGCTNTCNRLYQAGIHLQSDKIRMIGATKLYPPPTHKTFPFIKVRSSKNFHQDPNPVFFTRFEFYFPQKIIFPVKSVSQTWRKFTPSNII